MKYKENTKFKCIRDCHLEDYIDLIVFRKDKTYILHDGYSNQNGYQYYMFDEYNDKHYMSDNFIDMYFRTMRMDKLERILNDKE